MVKTCQRCGSIIKRACGLCSPCETKVRQEATDWQERDYLARWLHGRVDAAGKLITDSAVVATSADRRCILRLLAKARAQGVDWRNPPEPLTFDKRLAILTQRTQPKPRKRRQAVA
jgi:hypothetical protein